MGFVEKTTEIDLNMQFSAKSKIVVKKTTIKEVKIIVNELDNSIYYLLEKNVAKAISHRDQTQKILYCLPKYYNR